MKRKIISTITAVGLSLSLLLTGCGGNTNAPADSGKKDAPAESKVESKFPEKPVNFIVPYAPGGSSDLIARTLAKASEKYLGQSLVIINKPGGATNIGYTEIAQSKADGYTVGTANNSLVTQPIFGNTKIDYPNEMEAIAQVGRIPYVLAVSADSQFKTLDDLVNYAKENPGKIKYGHIGIGTTTHISMEKLAKDAGIKIEQVAFDGGSKAVVALLGGHIQATVQTPLDFKEQVKAGKLRIIAVAGDKRIDDPLYKDVPTFIEKGYDVKAILWQGVAAPKGLPEDAKKKLLEGFKGMVNDPEVKKTIEDLGLKVEYLSGEDFKKFWTSDTEYMTKVLTETGILEQIKSQKK